MVMFADLIKLQDKPELSLAVMCLEVKLGGRFWRTSRGCFQGPFILLAAYYVIKVQE